MMFSELHWIPSAIATVLIIILAFVKDKGKHRTLAVVMALFAIIGLVGFFLEGDFDVLTFDIHSLHVWLGTAALVLSLSNVALAVYLNRKGRSAKKKSATSHCMIGYAAAILAFAALLSGFAMLGNQLSLMPQGPLVRNLTNLTLQVPASNVLAEVEANEFMGINLTPMSKQNNNAINGTQYINKSTYVLHVTGLVENDVNLSYGQLLALPAYSEVANLPCVEGWSFAAQWTGFRVIDLLNLAGLKPNATYVVFYGADGYSTGLPLSYLRDRQILMAYGINNVTLPPERGFPFQVVAVNKYGYKWAKWITRIDVVNQTVEGYWESRGYSNTANASS
jgi:DMSO/TMAO reductase YedYZ molybdopterin-dependent catalytic subunit